MPRIDKLTAVIGVIHDGGRTLYFRRSKKMQNYPDVWSLLSIQTSPAYPMTNTIEWARPHFDRMSIERLGGAKVETLTFLTAGESESNPTGRHVHLSLFRLAADGDMQLNPDYYTDMRWMTAAEFEAASTGQRCGLCVRLWSDYAWMAGLTDRPFVPQPEPAAS